VGEGSGGEEGLESEYGAKNVNTFTFVTCLNCSIYHGGGGVKGYGGEE
jgi:hypothetical protein